MYAACLSGKSDVRGKRIRGGLLERSKLHAGLVLLHARCCDCAVFWPVRGWESRLFCSTSGQGVNKRAGLSGWCSAWTGRMENIGSISQGYHGDEMVAGDEVEVTVNFSRQLSSLWAGSCPRLRWGKAPLRGCFHSMLTQDILSEGWYLASSLRNRCKHEGEAGRTSCFVSWPSCSAVDRIEANNRIISSPNVCTFPWVDRQRKRAKTTLNPGERRRRGYAHRQPYPLPSCHRALAGPISELSLQLPG
ncbi:hypothetical protein QBC39DRAFT_360865 [Podospora conica]|nr:hypothetical protein QBC39DRAFT_360865 [Schizothecium conicum]